MTRGWPMACEAERPARTGGSSRRPTGQPQFFTAAAIVILSVALVVAPFLPRTVRTRIEPAVPDLLATVVRMERQAAVLSASMDEVTARYVRDVEPIERALLRRARDPWLARQAAWAIVAEAETRDLSPALVAAVMMVENPWLVADTVSYAGAVGLMQVMPLHLGSHDCGPDLTDGDVNVCYGAAILREYIGAALDEALRDALLRYSGCRATPGCEKYAAKVVNLTED